MDNTLDEQRTAAQAAIEANRFAEAYQLWLPLAEAGDVEAQAQVGAIVANGLHRFDILEDANAGPTPDEATRLADQAAGARYLEAASAAGNGPASFNLAGLYVTGYGGGSWEESKARAAALYALANAQGFRCFSHLMDSDGAGQPYLDIVEPYFKPICDYN